MLEFEVWRDLAASYVRLQAARLGWTYTRAKHSKTTRSLYLYLVNGGREVTVRLSDHRSVKLCRRSCFSVRQRGTGRLVELATFLATGAYVSSQVAPVVVEPSKPDDVSMVGGEATVS